MKLTDALATRYLNTTTCRDRRCVNNSRNAVKILVNLKLARYCLLTYLGLTGYSSHRIYSLLVADLSSCRSILRT